MDRRGRTSQIADVHSCDMRFGSGAQPEGEVTAMETQALVSAVKTGLFVRHLNDRLFSRDFGRSIVVQPRRPGARWLTPGSSFAVTQRDACSDLTKRQPSFGERGLRLMQHFFRTRRTTQPMLRSYHAGCPRHPHAEQVRRRPVK